MILEDALCNSIRGDFKVKRSHKPLFVEFLGGRNLQKFAEYGQLFKLTPEQLLHLGQEFGKVAGYDFLIANSDRFVPSHFDGTIKKYFCINSGNILIEMDQDKIKSVHLIDNAPYFEDFFSNNEIMGIQDSSDDEDSEETHERAIFHEDFQEFMDGDDSYLKLMAEQIKIGIVNDISEAAEETYKVQYDLFSEDKVKLASLEKGLFLGLKEAQTTLASAPISETVNSLRQKYWTKETSRIMLNFIEVNSLYIKRDKVDPETPMDKAILLLQSSILEQLETLTLAMPSKGEASNPSQVAEDNPHRALLEAVRECLMNLDNEKIMRISYMIQEAVSKDPENPQLAIVLKRVKEVIAHFKSEKSILFSPQKPIVPTSKLDTSKKVHKAPRRLVFDE